MNLSKFLTKSAKNAIQAPVSRRLLHNSRSLSFVVQRGSNAPKSSTNSSVGRSSHGTSKSNLSSHSLDTKKDANLSQAIAIKNRPPAQKDAKLNEIPVFITRQEAIVATFEQNQHLEKSLMVKDLGVVRRQYYRWESNLPKVRPFYAVKCNPDPMILETLAAQGAGFDCATSAEIKLALTTGVTPDEIIFANPVKTMSDIAYARSMGVKKMTFDNADELIKIHALFPEAELVLRLLPDDSGSLMRFGSKFGADEEVADELLALAQNLHLKVIGTSFHIGSGCYNPEKYDSALAMCRRVFDKAAAMGAPMSFLDLGGGFPGGPVEASEGIRFEDFTAVIRKGLAEYFPEDVFPSLKMIGEPGRYMVSNCGVLFTKVTGKRVQKGSSEQKKVLYYVNDGVYGAFNCIMYDHYNPTPIPATEYIQQLQKETGSVQITPTIRAMSAPIQAAVQRQAQASYTTDAKNTTLGTFFGPTCDSMDKIVQDFPISELQVGDWVAFKEMGAYTSAAATRFNGCHLAHVSYCHSLTD